MKCIVSFNRTRSDGKENCSKKDLYMYQYTCIFNMNDNASRQSLSQTTHSYIKHCYYYKYRYLLKILFIILHFFPRSNKLNISVDLLLDILVFSHLYRQKKNMGVQIYWDLIDSPRLICFKVKPQD